MEPREGDVLRRQYEDIIPGYYMNKTHWNSVKADGNVPDDLLKDLLDKSYRLVLGSLSRKKQRELLETRDPQLSEEEFMRTVSDRVKRLKGR